MKISVQCCRKYLFPALFYCISNLNLHRSFFDTYIYDTNALKCKSLIRTPDEYVLVFLK